MGVCILPGVTIGEGCVVGAGAVVAKDLTATAIAVGNPARPIRDRRGAAREGPVPPAPAVHPRPEVRRRPARRAAEIALGFAYQGRTLTRVVRVGRRPLRRLVAAAARRPGRRARRRDRRVPPHLIHSHNLPDSLTVLALEVTEGRIPVVHDSHDLQSLRRTPYEDGFDDPEDPAALEKAAVEGCAALVAVVGEMLAGDRGRHRPPAADAAVRQLRPGPRHHPVPRGRRRAGAAVVYQGSVSANGSHYDLREGLAASRRPGSRSTSSPTATRPSTGTSPPARPGCA